MAQRILVVEDEFLVALDLETMLHSLGRDVVGPAATVDDGLALASEAALDGALLDINVAGQEVFPIADRLTKRAIPFAFTTGYDARSVLPERFATTSVLRKPYDEERLAQLVRKLFGPAPD